MPQLIRGSKVVIVPKEGAIEITLNVNITLDGKVTATSDGADVKIQEEEDKTPYIMPDFGSGFKVGSFGKKE